MATFFDNLPLCLLSMQACGSANHWARQLQATGHTVHLMASQFVKPFVKTNKNDAAPAPRQGAETALARVVAVMGAAARPHHAYLFANRQADA